MIVKCDCDRCPGSSKTLVIQFQSSSTYGLSQIKTILSVQPGTHLLLVRIKCPTGSNNSSQCRGGSRGGGQGALAPAPAEKCPQLWKQFILPFMDVKDNIIIFLFRVNPCTALKNPNFEFGPPPRKKLGPPLQWWQKRTRPFQQSTRD